MKEKLKIKDAVSPRKRNHTQVAWDVHRRNVTKYARGKNITKYARGYSTMSSIVDSRKENVTSRI